MESSRRLDVSTALLVVVVAAAALAAARPSSSSGTPPRCQSRALRLAATFYGEAGGQFIQTFTFTNRSRRACRMSGWPRVEVETASHRLVPVRSQRVIQGPPTGRPFSTVLLRPRAAASFDVYGSDWDFARNRACPTATRVRVTPPGGGAPLRVRVEMPNCPGGFLIAPVIAGPTDRDSWSVVWH